MVWGWFWPPPFGQKCLRARPLLDALERFALQNAGLSF